MSTTIPDTELSRRARREMRAEVREARFKKRFYEVTLMGLAKNAANFVNHDEWLDDDTHWIWTMARDEYFHIDFA